jgi:ribulose-phosphate 3-epimerase
MSEQDISACRDSIIDFAPALHLDVDDAVFAPLFTWPYTGPGSLRNSFDLKSADGLPVDVHLMVKDPEAIGIEFARAGAECVMGHLEVFASASEATRVLKAWRDAGASEVGLGILFNTPIENIESFVRECDVIHMMSIGRIGTQGIPYNATAPARIADFHVMYPEMTISVDGGVSETNIADLVRAGARRFGIGSAISKAPDPKVAYESLLKIAEGALQ